MSKVYEETFGALGALAVSQFTAERFLDATKSGTEADHTGKRCYGGVVALCEILGESAPLRQLLCDAAVAELGCGVGLLGLALRRCSVAQLFLTDGEESTVDWARDNIETAGERAVCRVLEWTNSSQLRLVLETLEAESGRTAFDVVVGTDLLYYRTDVEALVHCVAGLLFGQHERDSGIWERPKVGVFLQQFRVRSQPEDFQAAARDRGLHLVSIPLGELLSSDDHVRQLSDLIIAFPAVYLGDEGALSLSAEMKSVSSWQALNELFEKSRPFDPQEVFDEGEEDDEVEDEEHGTAAEGQADGLPDVTALLELLDRERDADEASVEDDVIVVGAGLAGLACARELAKNGRSVLILEAKSEPGGRVRTCDLPSLSGPGREHASAFSFDAGAAWIHGTQGNPVAEMLAASGVQLVEVAAANPWMHPQFMRGRVLVYDEASKDCVIASNEEKRFAEQLFRDLAKKASDVCRSLPERCFAEAFWSAFQASDCCNRCSSLQLALVSWNMHLASLWFGRDVLSMAPDTFEHCFLGSYLDGTVEDGMTPSLDLFGDYPGPHCKPNGGMRFVVDHLVQEVLALGVRIRYGVPVTKIASVPGHSTATCKVAVSTSKERFMGSACVITSSIRTLVDESMVKKINGSNAVVSGEDIVARIKVVPDPPKEMNRIVLGRYEKLLMRCSDRDATLQELTAGLPFLGVVDQLGAVKQLLKVAPSEVESDGIGPCILFEKCGANALIASLVGGEAERALQLDAETLGHSLTKRLNDAVVALKPDACASELQPVDFFLSSWGADPHFGGSYSDVDAGAATEDIEELLRSCRRGSEGVFFAGEALHPEYMGSVHGAIETGLWTAQDVGSFLEGAIESQRTRPWS